MNEHLKKIAINGLYLLNLIFYILALKSLNYFYLIDNPFFCCLLFSLIFPFLFVYFIYKKLSINKLELSLGTIDFLQLLLLYIGINKLNIAEYIAYRTFSLFFNMFLSYFFLNKRFNYVNIIGNIIIAISCIVLIGLGQISNIVYALIVIFSSFLYSYLGFLMEKYKDENNYINTKLISSFLALTTYYIYNLFNNSVNLEIIKNTSFLFWALTIFVSFSELLFYYTKYLVIKLNENGSIYTNILDIFRRIITLIIGILIFKDNYPNYLYGCLSVILLGSSLINFNETIYNFINKLRNRQQLQEIREEIV